MRGLRPLQDILLELCPRKVLGVRMRCASRSSAAAGMHASMLSLFALEMHKAMQPAQLRRLQAITCVHVLCSLRSGNATGSTLRAFIEGYVRQPLGTLESKDSSTDRFKTKSERPPTSMAATSSARSMPECLGVSFQPIARVQALSRSSSATMEDYSCADHDSISDRMARRAMRAASWHTHT